MGAHNKRRRRETKAKVIDMWRAAGEGCSPFSLRAFSNGSKKLVSEESKSALAYAQSSHEFFARCGAFGNTHALRAMKWFSGRILFAADSYARFSHASSLHEKFSSMKQLDN